MQYIRNLDGVRGAAILLVMLFHYQYALEFGWVGVQLFFVLSGFLITSILLEDKARPLAPYLSGFYWRRTLRIFPVYFIYLFGISATYFYTHMPEDLPKTFPFLLTYTYNLYPLFFGLSFDAYFTHFWSLSIEEQFYLVWPLLVYLLSVKQLRVALVVLILLAPVVRFVMAEYLLQKQTDPGVAGQIVYRFTLSQCDGFAFGAAIPLFNLRERLKSPSAILLICMAAVLVIGFLNYLSLLNSGIIVGPSSLGYPIAVLTNYQHVWSYTILAFFSMLLILCCLEYQEQKIFKAVFGNPVLVFFGKLSYGLYIYHWVIGMAFSKFLKSHFPFWIAGFATYMVICLVVAYLSMVIVERPILNLKGKFFKR